MTFTEPRPCPICGHDDETALIELPGFQFFLDPPRRVDVRQVQCRHCFGLYMNPVYAPGAVAELFRDAGPSYRSSPERTGEQAAWLAARGCLEPGRAVLDVGCFEGRFLAALPHDVRKLGIDVDAAAVEQAHARLAGEDAEIVHGDLRTLPDWAPDTITLFHLLEHLPDPLALLRGLRATATGHTRLVVEVPIVERGATNDLVGFFTVQHTTHFSRRSLAGALRAAGWEPLETHEELEYNGCRVLAAPGATAAPEGDPGDADAAATAIAAWDAAARDVTRRLDAVRDRVQIWGAGLHLEYLFQRTPLFSRPRAFTIVDSDPLKQGGTWRGHAIGAPASLAPEPGVPLVASSYDSQDEITAAAIERGVAAADVVRLYDRVVAY